MIIVHICWDVRNEDDEKRWWEFESDINTGYTEEEWDLLNDDTQHALIEDAIKEEMDRKVTLAWYEDKDKRKDNDKPLVI